MRVLGRPHGSEFSASIRDTTLRTGWAQTDIAINAWTVEICRPLKPHWTVLDHRQYTACQSPPVPPDRKSYPAERSALKKALAFQSAGKMPEAREWATELVRR
jgi:hypothetical protein